MLLPSIFKTLRSIELECRRQSGMVSFTCNSCGNTVRKNQVEKHYQSQCPSCDTLSCIDCGRDFVGNAYASHTSCITEAEKYQGKLYQAKAKQNKGDVKQKGWMEQIQNSSSRSVNPRLKSHLKRIREHANVPRKKAKFEALAPETIFSSSPAANYVLEAMGDLLRFVGYNRFQTIDLCQNFCENSLRIHDKEILTELWDHFSFSSNKKQEESSSRIDACATQKEDSSNANNTTNENGKFRWHKAIKQVMKESKKKRMSIKKMKQKVLAEYNQHNHGKAVLSLEEFDAKFHKKLTNSSKMTVAKDRVWFSI